MPELLKLTACEADTELREMRHALLKRLTDLEKLSAYGTPLEKTRLRIAALNRALLSLGAERPGQQAELLPVAPRPVAAPVPKPRPGRSPYGG